MTSFTEGQAVEIMDMGKWEGPFTVTSHTGRTPEHLVLSGPSGLFELYNDAPYNVRPVEVAPVEATPEAPAATEATPVRSQDYCPRCSRLIALHADGTFYAHGPRAHRCPASGQEATQAPAEVAEEVTAEDIELARAATFALFATPAEDTQPPAEAQRAEWADRMGRAARIDADVERITARKTPVQRAEEIRRGDEVEYLHTATQEWRPAVVLSFRASDDAVLVTREDGTTDAAPRGNVRRPATGRLYAVEANSSGVAFPIRAASMHDAIRAAHTETRHPVIVDGLTPDSGYTSNVDPEGTHHFIVDGVNAYAVRALSPEEAEETARRATAPAPRWDVRSVEDIRKGDRVAFHRTSEGRRVLSAGVVAPHDIAITYDEAGAPTVTKPAGTRVFIQRRSEAEVMARVTGSRGATVVHERRNEDGTLTEVSRETYGDVTPRPAQSTRKAWDEAWRAVVKARQAWRDYPGTRVVTGADGRPAIHPRALPVAKALALAEAALDAARQG